MVWRLVSQFRVVRGLESLNARGGEFGSVCFGNCDLESQYTKVQLSQYTKVQLTQTHTDTR